jgi:hypothetical protein
MSLHLGKLTIMQMKSLLRQPLALLALVFTVCLFIACGSAEEKTAESADTTAVEPAPAPAPAPVVSDSLADGDSTRDVVNPKPPPKTQ